MNLAKPIFCEYIYLKHDLLPTRSKYIESKRGARHIILKDCFHNLDFYLETSTPLPTRREWFQKGPRYNNLLVSRFVSIRVLVWGLKKKLWETMTLFIMFVVHFFCYCTYICSRLVLAVRENYFVLTKLGVHVLMLSRFIAFVRVRGEMVWVKLGCEYVWMSVNICI